MSCATRAGTPGTPASFHGVPSAIFTNADNYAITVEPSLTDPLRSLVLGAALTVDLLLKQVKN